MSERKRHINKIKILYSNVEGIISKLIQIKDILAVKKLQIGCLTETKLSNNIANDTLNIYICVEFSGKEKLDIHDYVVPRQPFTTGHNKKKLYTKTVKKKKKENKSDFQTGV